MEETAAETYNRVETLADVFSASRRPSSSNVRSIAPFRKSSRRRRRRAGSGRGKAELGQKRRLSSVKIRRIGIFRNFSGNVAVGTRRRREATCGKSDFPSTFRKRRRKNRKARRSALRNGNASSVLSVAFDKRLLKLILETILCEIGVNCSLLIPRLARSASLALGASRP